MGSIKARPVRAFIRATDTVLDFGCGGGDLLLALSCARRFGIEPNDAARTVAIAAGIDTFPTLDDIANASIDIAITHHALEHCMRPLDELRGLRRVLRSDGRLV